MTVTQTPEAVRAARLAEFNAVLAERNLSGLITVGDHTRGWIELTGIVEILDKASRFFTDIRFSTIFPNGGTGEYTIKFNANSAESPGTVVVAVINGRFAMVRQPRTTLGKWTTEVPRAFGSELAVARVDGRLADVAVGDLKPLTVIFDELRPEVMSTLSDHKVSYLGSLPENSGTHAVVPEFYLAILTVDEESLKDRKVTMTEAGIKLELESYAAAKRHAEDAHSIMALYKFEDRIRELLAEAGIAIAA